jgi:hypothetical protein
MIREFMKIDKTTFSKVFGGRFSGRKKRNGIPKIDRAWRNIIRANGRGLR